MGKSLVSCFFTDSRCMYVVLRPTPHKTGHFGDVSPSKESLGLVRRKLNLTQQKRTFTTHTHTHTAVGAPAHTHTPV